MGEELLDAQELVIDLRQRVLRGEEVPPEELAKALAQQRVAREAAVMKPKTKKKKVVKKKEATDAKT